LTLHSHSPSKFKFESTDNGTAVEGIDFVHISGALFIPANEMAGEVSSANLLYNPTLPVGLAVEIAGDDWRVL
jgi:hypothetical protein